MPGPLEVQYIEVAENLVLLQTFNLKTKFIMSERALIMSERALTSFGVLWLQNARIISRNISSVNNI